MPDELEVGGPAMLGAGVGKLCDITYEYQRYSSRGLRAKPLRAGGVCALQRAFDLFRLLSLQQKPDVRRRELGMDITKRAESIW